MTCLSCPGRTLQIVDLVTAELRCVIHGSTYLHRCDDGTWETSKERMRRTLWFPKCQHCGKKFEDHVEKYKTDERTCPKCHERRMTETARKQWSEIRGGKRDNPNSPWRIGFEKRKDGYYKASKNAAKGNLSD